MTSQLVDRSVARAVTGGRGRGPRGRFGKLSGAVSRCPVPACSERIDRSRLMCRSHWYQVPKALRDRVWATWRSGLGADSAKHKDAVSTAIATIVTWAVPPGQPGGDAAGGREQPRQ